jgi:hypothetical protein
MICFAFASRSRPAKFFECLNNLRDMAVTEYFVLAKIDDDQKELYRGVESYPEVIVKYGRSLNKVHAINRDIDPVANPFDILCCHSDDMFFTKKGFDILIKEHCTDDTFVHFPDQTKLCTYSIMDKIYFSRFNYVYNPAYRNLWCDNEAMEVAKMLGRYKFVDEKILEHRHPANGFATRDMQYRKTEATYWIDKRTFDKRKLKRFDLPLI